MHYSKKQWIASIFNRGNENTYIRNKREKGQKRYFKCSCCGEVMDFNDSDDYVGAVEQWESLGKKCYACGHGYCHCKETGKKWG